MCTPLVECCCCSSAQSGRKPSALQCAEGLENAAAAEHSATVYSSTAPGAKRRKLAGWGTCLRAAVGSAACRAALGVKRARQSAPILASALCNVHRSTFGGSLGVCQAFCQHSKPAVPRRNRAYNPAPAGSDRHYLDFSVRLSDVRKRASMEPLPGANIWPIAHAASAWYRAASSAAPSSVQRIHTAPIPPR